MFRRNLTFYPLFESKFEIRASQNLPQTKFELDSMKTGEVRILRRHECELDMIHMLSLPSFNFI